MPNPIKEKPINRQDLVWRLRMTQDAVRSAVRDLEVVERNLKKAIKEVATDV